MFIDRRQLTEIIAHEVRNRLAELSEIESNDSGRKRSRRKKPDTTDAEDSPSPKGEPPPGPGGDRPDDGSEMDGSGPDPEASDDDAASHDADDALDPEGDAAEDPTGAVNNELSGKTIQAVTVEPQSKILPGAKEVVVTFRETSDALRVLITATGQVKFFLGGQIHDLP